MACAGAKLDTIDHFFNSCDYCDGLARSLLPAVIMK
jgi:hypothetical protein